MLRGDVTNRVKLSAKREIDLEFYRAASVGTVAQLKDLIAAGADPDAPIHNDIGDDFYAIHQAALNPDIEVLKYVVSLGVDPCRIDFWARQPLAFAVRKNPLPFAEYLVGLGNEPGRVDDDGMPMMAESASNPDLRVLEYLLSKGAAIDEGADDCLPLGYALLNSTPERVRWFIEHGADLRVPMEMRAFNAPLENLRVALELGYDPNTIDYSDEGTKVIDHLDPKRQAIFAEFGGKVQDANAEKYWRKYMGSIEFYQRYGAVDYDGRRFSLCEDPASDNSPELSPAGVALGVSHEAEHDCDGFYPCATVYFADGDYRHPLDVTEGAGESFRFNPQLCEFRTGADAAQKER